VNPEQIRYYVREVGLYPVLVYCAYRADVAGFFVANRDSGFVVRNGRLGSVKLLRDMAASGCFPMSVTRALLIVKRERRRCRRDV